MTPFSEKSSPARQTLIRKGPKRYRSFSQAYGEVGPGESIYSFSQANPEPTFNRTPGFSW